MPTIKEALQHAARRLAAGNSPRLDAELLLAHTLQCGRTHLTAWPERALTPDAWESFQVLVGRREQGEPVAYLLGRREFWSLELQVTADTLIPRPETELLVEMALRWLPADPGCSMADLGTGSGAVALAVGGERPDCRIIATDIAEAALDTARANAHRLGLANVEFRGGNWLEPLAGERVSMIVSNPPYIAEGDAHLTQGDVRFEPERALVSGPRGLDAILCISHHAPKHLQPGGRLLLEHGFDQGPAVRRLLGNGGYTGVETYKDLEGRERVTAARWFPPGR